MFKKAPYNEAFDIIEGVTKNETKFVRVHTKENKLGKWMMKESDIKGLSPEQIRDKFALPDVPTQISDVVVPAGTNIRVGVAGKVKGWGNGGGTQVEVLQRVDNSWLKNTREIK